MVQSFLKKFTSSSSSTQKKSTSPKQPQAQVYSHSITIIGPRSSGKTTYLAGLSYLPQRRSQNQNQSKNRISYRVKALNSNAEQLYTDVQNVIMEGLEFDPSSDVTEFIFNITIEQKNQQEIITLNTKDFAGEGLDYIDQVGSKYRNYLEECLKNKKNPQKNFLILLGNWDPDYRDNNGNFVNLDATFCQTIKTFKKIAEEQCDEDQLKQLRFALVMNKCEKGELWPLRLSPEEDIFDRYLRDTTDEIRGIVADFGIPPKNLEFFAMSTFGVRGDDDPRPNRKDPETRQGDRGSTLLINRQWKPYGMLSPIYWLATGKRLPDHV